MLLELKIKNFVIIDDLSLQFDRGLNIFTGETGAGKSILIDAISGILGGKMHTGQIRTGYELAVIEGVFDITGLDQIERLISETGAVAEKGIIRLKRELYASGKGRCYAGTVQIPATKLKEIGENLIDIHGQNEHQTISATSRQRELLDSFAGTSSDVEDMKMVHARLHDLRQRLESFNIDEREKARRIEFNTFAVNEINAARLVPGEDEELKNESSLLANGEKLFTEINSASSLFNDDQGILQRLRKAEKSLASVSPYDPDISGILETLRESLYSLEDTASFLRDYEKNIDFSPQRINQVEERIALISSLKKKYGETIETIIAYGENALRENEAISSSDEEKEKLGETHRALVREAKEKALVLSKRREEAAVDLEQKVMAELNDLAMAGTSFRISLTRDEQEKGDIEADNTRYALYPHGLDRIEFLIAANRGESLKPLKKVASGGEMSRIMLAIKNVILGQDIVETLIFDEVDTGIGGKTADTVGKKLKSLSRKSQVLLITHLPQIAAMSDTHFQVLKSDNGDRTLSTVKRLSRAEKIREIARMIAGEEVTGKSLEHAEELVSLAEAR